MRRLHNLAQQQNSHLLLGTFVRFTPQHKCSSNYNCSTCTRAFALRHEARLGGLIPQSSPHTRGINALVLEPPEPTPPTHNNRACRPTILLLVSNHDMPHFHIVDLVALENSPQGLPDVPAMAFSWILSALEDNVPDHTDYGQ